MIAAATPMTTLTRASCPGKVLLCGGYLVLEKDTPGLVISVTSRFESALEVVPLHVPSSPPSASVVRIPCVVVSRQFHVWWHYELCFKTAVDVPVLKLVSSSPSTAGDAVASVRAAFDAEGLKQSETSNSYVEYAINTSLLAVAYGVGHFSWCGKDNQSLASRLSSLDSAFATLFSGMNPSGGPSTASSLVSFLALSAASATAAAPSSSASSSSSSSSARSAFLRLTLSADNDFYSQRSHLVDRGLPISTTSLASLPKHMPCPKAASGSVRVNKTGLGSSAALVSSAVAATMCFLLKPALERVDGRYTKDKEATVAEGARLVAETGQSGGAASSSDFHMPSEFRTLIHNVAQVAHGLAQGKIGSGFDVCAAIYGSNRFIRIPPTVLGLAMETVEKAITAKRAASDCSTAHSNAEIGNDGSSGKTESSSAEEELQRIAGVTLGSTSRARTSSSSSSSSSASSTSLSSSSSVPASLSSVHSTAAPASVSTSSAHSVHAGADSAAAVNTSSSSSSASSVVEAAASPEESVTKPSLVPIDWTFSADPFGLPPSLRLLLADVSGGSETPGMVRKVLEWRDKDAVANEAASSNSSIASLLHKVFSWTVHASDSANEHARSFVSANAGMLAEVHQILEERLNEAATAPSSSSSIATTSTPTSSVHSSPTLRHLLEKMILAARSATGPPLWRSLAAANVRFEETIKDLDRLESEILTARQLAAPSLGSGGDWKVLFASMTPSEWSLYRSSHAGNSAAEEMSRIADALANVWHAAATARSLLRLLGEASGVPIEPPVQTELLNATSDVRGVVAAGVPGAGGFDAIFCVFLGVDGVDRRVEDCWLSWMKDDGGEGGAVATGGGGLTPLLLRNGPPRDAPGAGVIVHF